MYSKITLAEKKKKRISRIGGGGLKEAKRIPEGNRRRSKKGLEMEGILLGHFYFIHLFRFSLGPMAVHCVANISPLLLCFS